jgi:hypothetical protein
MHSNITKQALAWTKERFRQIVEKPTEIDEGIKSVCTPINLCDLVQGVSQIA